MPSDTTALELVRDLIMANTDPQPVPGTNLFVGYELPTAPDIGLVWFISEAPSKPPELTMGTVVAVEHQGVDVIIYGSDQDYRAPRSEAVRLRYVIATQNGYTSRGLRMLYAQPTGNVQSLGRDPDNRAVFMVSFDVWVDPSL